VGRGGRGGSVGSVKMVLNKQKQVNSLYKQDYYLWIEQTIELLQEQKFNEIDLSNLIEEIKDMGKSEKRAITSNLRILLMHLLKYQYQAEKRSNSWLFTIVEHRQRIQELLETSPSLKSSFYPLGDSD
jgi:predicted DNA-binding ribbon-helix-helix protein